MLRETQLTAGRLGIALRTFAVRGLDEFEPTFAPCRANRRPCKQRPPAGHVRCSRLRCGGWCHGLGNELRVFVSASRRLLQKNTKSYKPRRTAGRAAHQV